MALPLPDGASIILNASIIVSKGLPGWSVYSAAKAAVRSFARTWTTDMKARRIRVNAEHQTSLPGVWAAGDCVPGEDLTVIAVQGGKIAAHSIDRALRS